MTEPITPTKTYLLVCGALLVLTVATVALSFLNLGAWNTLIALGIAVCKAVLITLFFMHARFSRGITRLVIFASVLWLSILLVGTMDDILTRGWLDVPGK